MRKKPQCRKRRYPNRVQALSALAGISRKHNQSGYPDRVHEVRAYRCGTCGGWHLTSMPKEDW